jgi:hypothetical protein
MLFHVTHVHTAETCPADSPDRIKATFGQMFKNAADEGVTLHSVYSNTVNHTFYMVAETDDMAKISAVFAPTLKLGTASIVPIQDAKEVMAQFTN